METVVSTVQEGHQDITDTIVEKTTKARGPGHPQGAMKTNQTPAAAYNIKKWMQGLEEDASNAEVRNGKASNHSTEWRNVHSQCVGRHRRWHRRQGILQLLRHTSSGSPSSGGGSSDWGSKQSSHPLTMMTGSRESNHARKVGSGLGVKVNLPIFKDEKTKDAVIYSLWQWNVAISTTRVGTTNTC